MAAAARGISVVVLGGEGPQESLRHALGDERADETHALLLARARAWAEALAGPTAVQVVAATSFQSLVPGEAPLVAIRPELARWPPELAAAALGDLADGCALSLAPIFDGGLYLLALAGGIPELPAALGELDLAGPGGMGALLGRAEREGWEVGLLRAERGVRRAEDVRAVLADPLTDAELRGVLGELGGRDLNPSFRDQNPAS